MHLTHRPPSAGGALDPPGRFGGRESRGGGLTTADLPDQTSVGIQEEEKKSTKKAKSKKQKALDRRCPAAGEQPTLSVYSA